MKSRIYGYARVSTSSQSIERQTRNILSLYPEAIIIKEAYTGTVSDRPKWNLLKKRLCQNDTIVFDSVCRMSRNATEGVALYFDLIDKGINLVFIKEPYINSKVYEETQKDRIQLSGGAEDLILIGLNNYFRQIAKRQIEIAFEAAEKEVVSLHHRTREGIETARIAGKQIGQQPGIKLNVKIKEPAKDIIRRHSKTFGGQLSDKECIKLTGVSRNTYYKYKKEVQLSLS